MQIAKAVTMLTAIIALIAAIIVGLGIGKCHRKLPLDVGLDGCRVIGVT